MLGGLALTLTNYQIGDRFRFWCENFTKSKMTLFTRKSSYDAHNLV